MGAPLSRRYGVLVCGNPHGSEMPASRGGQGGNGVSAGNDQCSPTAPGGGEAPDFKEKTAGANGPVAPDEAAPKKLLRWLGVIAGLLAILTFLGIANYHQLASALGWDSSSTSPQASDSADSKVCALAQADITKTNSDAPAGPEARFYFYYDQNTAFNTLPDKAKNRVLRNYMFAVWGDIGELAADWAQATVGENKQQNIDSTTASLNRDEQTLESWCLAHTGAS
jgi:hypothetical protein